MFKGGEHHTARHVARWVLANQEAEDTGKAPPPPLLLGSRGLEVFHHQGSDTYFSLDQVVVNGKVAASKAAGSQAAAALSAGESLEDIPSHAKDKGPKRRYTAGPIMYLKRPCTGVEVARKYLRNEKIFLGKLSHPNIIESAPALAKPTDDFLVMPRFGARLTQLPDELGAGIITREMFFERIEQMLQGLIYLHSHNIVHRDIQPHNILVDTTTARVRIAEFGIAVQLDQGESAHGVFGTPGFMAPEVLRGQAYGTPADMYSFGATLYTLLCGSSLHTAEERSRFQLPSSEDRNLRVTNGALHVPGLSINGRRRLRNLMLALLEEDPAKRPTAEQALEYLQEHFMGDNLSLSSDTDSDMSW